MPMQVAPSEKFACFAFTFYGLDQDMPDEVQIGPRLWALRKLDLHVAEHWARGMGSVKMDALRDSNFVIYSTMLSTRPNDYDQENLDLVETLNYLLYGILLYGVPEYEQGFSLNGANVEGEINVRKFSDLRHYQPSTEMPSFRLGLNDLRRAARLIDRLRAVNTGGPDWPRLRRGLKVLFDGTRMLNKDGDRLHQLVRALEALVKPEIARTRSQFAHRISQMFTLTDGETRETLLQIFDLRSYVEHMHPVLDVLEGDEAARIATANRRTRQIDVLARSALLRVMESDALMEVFRSDGATDAFWQKADAERLALWGQRLDIRMVE
jgi:hypothetical protein